MWHHIRPEVYENILCQMPGVCICTHTVRLHHQDEPMHIDRRASLSPPTLYHISRLVWPRNFTYFGIQHIYELKCLTALYDPELQIAFSHPMTQGA